MSQDEIHKLEHMKELNDEDFRPWLNKCAALIQIGDFKNALINCEKASNLNSENPFAYFNKAAIYSFLHDKENAISSLKQALEKGILSLYTIEKIRTAPEFDYIRNDPRFEDLLKLYEKK